MRLFYIFILSVSALSYANAQKTRLSLKLKEGVTYKQSMTANSVVSQEFSGANMDLSMTIKGQMSYKVRKKNKDSYDMDVHYDRLSVQMKLPQGEMTFDSESTDEADIFSQIMVAMVDKEFYVKMARNGKVLEVSGIEVLFESIRETFPFITEEQWAPIKDQVSKSYGSEAFKGNIEMVTAIFPDKRVAPGDSWMTQTKLQTGMEADIHSTYTYVKTDKNHVLITGDARIETADKEAYTDVNGVPTKYDLNGSMTSTVKIDKKTGWIIDGQIEQKLSGDVSIKPLGTSEALLMSMNMVNAMSFSNN